MLLDFDEKDKMTCRADLQRTTQILYTAEEYNVWLLLLLLFCYRYCSHHRRCLHFQPFDGLVG